MEVAGLRTRHGRRRLRAAAEQLCPIEALMRGYRREELSRHLGHAAVGARSGERGRHRTLRLID